MKTHILDAHGKEALERKATARSVDYVPYATTLCGKYLPRAAMHTQHNVYADYCEKCLAIAGRQRNPKARTLSHRIEAIEYVHADDGQPYRHDFTKRGGTIKLLRDGSLKVTSKDAKLWDDFTQDDGRTQPFLINPAGRTRTIHRGEPMAKHRKMSALQRRYFGGKRKSNPKRRAKTVTRYVTRKRNAWAANPKRRSSRRRRRSNPVGFSVNSLLKRAKQGAIDSLLVVAGRAGARAISKQFPYAAGSVMDVVVEVGGAMALGIAAEKVLGSDRARFILAGALSSGVEDVIAQANIPFVSSLLNAYPNTSTAAIYSAADRSRALNAWQQPANRTLNAWQGGQPPLAGIDSLPSSTVSYLPS
jgi:hypothetical protein